MCRVCIYCCLLCGRWKGENVATTEVADILIMMDFIEEANVYGVKVPGMKSTSCRKFPFITISIRYI